MTLELTSEERATILLALSGWAERCSAEAKTMQSFAEDESLSEESRAKALRNVEASLNFRRASMGGQSGAMAGSIV